MKKILAFGASNSTSSINKTFASFAASKITDVEVNIADLNNFELPIYSPEFEEENGIPQNATDFKELINTADGIIISFAEHNGMLTVAFKNLFDWLSRIDQNIWNKKPMLILATSPGERGGASVLNLMQNTLPYFEANITGSFSLPSFYENFSLEGVCNKELMESLNEQLSNFQKELN